MRNAACDLRCQLDALYFHLYGLTGDEAGESLSTFPIVQRQDEARYNGRFRTRDLILAYIRAYAAWQSGCVGQKARGPTEADAVTRRVRRLLCWHRDEASSRHVALAPLPPQTYSA